MDDVTIAEMVRNGTMSAEMAAVIWSAVDEQVSFLTAAIPRFAGKTTTSEAALALRRAEVPLHRIDGSKSQTDRLAQDRLGGYLVVAEFEQAPMPGYIWGEPVRRVFNTLDDPNSKLSLSEVGRLAKEGGYQNFLKILRAMGSKASLGFDTRAITDSAWQRAIDAANIA